MHFFSFLKPCSNDREKKDRKEISSQKLRATHFIHSQKLLRKKTIVVTLLLSFYLPVFALEGGAHQVVVERTLMEQLLVDEYAQSISDFEEFISYLPKKLSREEARFLWGYYQFHLKNWVKVLQIFNGDWSDGFLFQDFVYYAMGVSFSALGDLDRANANFDLARGLSPKGRFSPLSLKEQVAIWVQKGDPAKALNKLLELKSRHPGNIHSFDLAWQEAQFHNQLGNRDLAKEILHSFYFKAPPRVQLEKIEGGLTKWQDYSWGTTQNQLKLIEKLIDKRHFSEAFDRLQKLPIPISTSEKVTYLYAKVLFGLKRYEDALPHFKQLSLVSNDKKIKKESISKAFSSMSRLKQHKESIEWLEKHLMMSQGKIADPYWLFLASLADRDYFKAIATLDNPVWHRRISFQDRAWWKGWSYYQVSMWEMALKTWSPLLSKRYEKYRGQVEYWYGKALENSGKKKEAARYWKKNVSKRIGYYYSWLSLKKLHPEGDDAREFIQKNWMESSGKAVSIRKHYRERTLKRIYWLVGLGLNEEAREELSHWYRFKSRKSKYKKEALVMAWQVGASEVAIRLALDSGIEVPISDRRLDSLAKVYWESVFPRGYMEFVTQESLKNELDPYLPLALIRAESMFQEDVISGAGAIGLMQVMPETGEALSRSLVLTGFNEEDLYNPETNIKLGTFYVRFLKKLFPEEKAFLIASYNAGEEAVSRWVDSKQDLDVVSFTEEIPYKETRNYVKKVLRFYWTYQWLYEKKLPFFEK